MMIMLLIPRLLVAVAVMLIVTDVGVIARHRPSSSWWIKPSPYLGDLKPRSPYFQTTHEENIYRPYKPPIPYFKSHSPYFQTTHEENIYRPYEPDLSSGIDSYVRKPSDKYNDDWTTNGPPQSLEVTTRSAMIDGNITLVGLQQNSSEPNITFKESHRQVLPTVPVVSSKADFSNINMNSHTKFMSDLREMIQRLKQDQRRFYSSTPVNQKTPGATVEHNLEEKELQTTKNLGQQQLPAEN